MDLNETLRAAVAEPPPTSIDLDVLIKRESRRERRQRWLAGGGIAAGVAATVGVTAAGFAGTLPMPFAGGGAPPCPMVSPKVPDAKNRGLEPSVSAEDLRKKLEASASGKPLADPSASGKPLVDPSASGRPLPGGGKVDPTATKVPGPIPSEPCGTAAVRLNRALTDALHRVAPAAKLTNADDEHRAPVWFQMYGDHSFVASLMMRDGERTNGLYVAISTYGEKPTGADVCAKRPQGGCTTETALDGTMLVVFRDSMAATIEVFRPDGTLISAAVKPWREGQQPVLSAEQLTEIGRTPGLTLFP